MRKDVSRKLSMAVRVRDFCRTHLSNGTKHPLVATLESLVDRSAELVEQARTGRGEEAAAAIRRLELRRTIQSKYLHHLVRVGQLAGNSDPRFAGKFRLRSADATHTSWLASARGMHALAESGREGFITLGLADTLLPDLGEKLDEFGRTMERGRAARVQRLHARASIEAVAEELGRIVTQLDGYLRFTLREDAALLEVWSSVRRIGPRVRSEPQPPSGGNTPPGGGLAPAA
jgi:hypothetical protein